MLFGMAINDHMPIYDDLSVFLDICETGGFGAIAWKLCLLPTSVSEKTARLEQQLGVPLLTRTTRSVTLTDGGRLLVERLSPCYREASAAVRDAASAHNEIRELLQLIETYAVMVDILPPPIDQFLARNQDVRLELVVEDCLVDAVAAGCDAGIRYGEHLSQDMVALPIVHPSIAQCLPPRQPILLRHPRIPATPWITIAFGRVFPAVSLTVKMCNELIC
jgi:DNA-binding transcriptional LysR family regulator